MRVLSRPILFFCLLVLTSACDPEDPERPTEFDYVELEGSFTLTGSNVCTEFSHTTRTKVEDYSDWEIIGVEDWYVSLHITFKYNINFLARHESGL